MFENEDNRLSCSKITKLNVDTYKYVKLLERHAKFL